MFFTSAGPMAIGSRLRILSEYMMDEAKKIYALYEIDLKPKWFPIFYVLSQTHINSVMAVAEEIGQSHPSVTKTIKEMVREGVVKEAKDETDGRKTLLLLTDKGQQIAQQIKQQYQDVGAAMNAMLNQSGHNIWKAMDEFEYLLDQKPFIDRVREQRKAREMAKVELIPYQPAYQSKFKQLNEEWISKWFKMEESDHRQLDDPDSYIIDKGGFILMARYEDELVGACALVKMEDPTYDYEMAKMGVAPSARGMGIGWMLGNAMIQEARKRGASYLYLESNTVLEPAIKLYEKLGFIKVGGRPTPYERSNIQMELKL